MEKMIREFNTYSISDSGYVKNNSSGKTLKPILRKDGYYQVGLHKEHKKHMKLVHRLVAEAFIPNPNNLPEVNHIDGNKKNNDLSNLEWVTRKENQQHAWRTGLHGEKNIIACKKNFSEAGKKYGKENLKKATKRWVEISSKPTAQLDLDGNIITIYPSQIEAKRKTGINNIGNVLTGRGKSAGGYKWMYIEHIKARLCNKDEKIEKQK